MAWIKITPPPDLLIAGRKTLLSLKTFIQKVVKLAGKLWVTVRQIILRRDLLLAAKRTQFTAFAADQFSGPDPAPQTRSPTVPAPLTVPVKLTFPFELNVEDIFTKQKPELLWKREATLVSKRVLNKMNKKQMQKYLSNIVYPCIIVE